MEKNLKNSKITGEMGLNFEYWLRCNLSWQLNLSPSKQVALDTEFYKFADFVRPIVTKAPEEFKVFQNELENRMNRIIKWRAPKGKCIIPIMFQGKPECFPNGKYRHRLVKREK